MLSVNGSKYNRKTFVEDSRDSVKFPLERGNSLNSREGGTIFGLTGQTMKSDVTNVQQTSNISPPLIHSPASQSPITVTPTATNIDDASINSQVQSITPSSASKPPKSIVYSSNENGNEDKYWKMPPPTGKTQDSATRDIVIIHVCDENQKISRDFCCKRDILVQHMKYFHKFLSENDQGYDDIDISVHCDVEIFEWLMAYIHEPNSPPKIDKSILVSILISSEFLQMDSLVELCINQMTQNLNEIVKLPIDLSCISERLINKIAQLTHPKILSEIRDRKDKILTKLYKRRVELDFSRKGSSKINTNQPNSSNRTIAAYLTCCRYCGSVYLENYVNNLICRKSPPTIDFRGNMVSRHSSIYGWSLTSYLKSLHSGGMGWDYIYWHVWAACVILKIEDVVISALEVDRYTVDPDGILIKRWIQKDNNDTEKKSGLTGGIALEDNYQNSDPKSLISSDQFSLEMEDDGEITNQLPKVLKLSVRRYDDSGSGSMTSTLNPVRPPDALTQEIYDLICSQMKFIVGLNHKLLLQNTIQSIVSSSKSSTISQCKDDYYLTVFGEEREKNSEIDEGRRGRSPGRAMRASSLDSRKVSQSMSKARSATPNQNSGTSTIPSSNLGDETLVPGVDNPGTDSDTGDPPVPNPINQSVKKGFERRARSSSTGKRASSANLLSKTSNVINRSSTSELDLQVINQIVDEQLLKQLEILQSLPPDISHRVSQQKLPIFGTWLINNPLQIHAHLFDEMLQFVFESNLSDHKRIEWELDLMREYDEKKMDKLERFLMSRRNPSFDPVLTIDKQKLLAYNQAKNQQSNVSNLLFSKSNNNSEYYKDRGRQPYRSII